MGLMGEAYTAVLRGYFWFSSYSFSKQYLDYEMLEIKSGSPI